VRRAHAAGYQALVLTVDVPVPGIRRADIRNQFSMPPHLKYEVVHTQHMTNLILFLSKIFVGWLTWKG
jgi:isopentenyl diphosphate isomerase/L-lactate dehydrogenase-like FMN-dependent dehydrogenase